MPNLPSTIARFIISILICLTNSFSATGSSQHIFHLTNGLTSAEVPFRLVENLIVVEVMLAGKRSLNFILDNGTSNPVIFQHSFIKGLNLPVGSRIFFRGIGDGKAVKATVIPEASLHLSGVATDRIGMVVLENNPFGNLRYGDTEIHGVLGSTLFRSFITEIDYPNRLIRLHQHDSFVCPVNFQALPMKVVEGKPLINVQIQGIDTEISAHLMIDLGFNNSLMLQLPDSLLDQILIKPRVSRIGTGYSGAVKGKSGKVASVQIGTQYIEEVITLSPFTRSFPELSQHDMAGRRGSIGNTLFQHTSIILNYPDEQFYYASPKRYIADEITPDTEGAQFEKLF
jgi:hypothetical protein